MLALGIVAAVAASCLYNTSIAMQAVEARTVNEAHGLRPSLLGRLVRNRRWLAATAIGLAGWPLEVCALLLAPLTVVQPCLASGLVLLLWLGATRLGERPGRREGFAVAAIVVGVSGVAWAAPERSTHHASAAGLALALALVAVPVMLPYALRTTGARSGALGAVSAGCGYAWTAIASKLLADGLSTGAPLAAFAWPLTALASEGVALLSEMSALQGHPATRVAPVMFATQVLVPVALAPLVFEERWSSTPGGGAALAAAIALAVFGTALLAGSRAVGVAIESAREGS